ncbi:hypothetical protein OG462_03730 [Streptomyces sp. NBC_01077]|uniref:hypothetical protein n=1 Tax=Streptomyces sp. NBC_01077 TaxID=2903746 RepID=UPI00386A24D0|nr:hypothetical protein OG462_03730 [Streptomyces sp. NBC_01077]
MSAVTVVVVAAGIVSGGAGVASATDPNDAPPGYAGPFSYCKGSRYDAIHLGDGHAYIDVYWISGGSGQLCAMTYDVANGRHSMGVTIRRTDWKTSWWDIGFYDRYAGAIYVGGMEGRCAEISGFIQHDDGRVYSNSEIICP